MSRIRVATGIDLPLAPSAGSPILCSDMYGSLQEGLHSTFLCLPSARGAQAWHHGFSEVIVCKVRKRPYGPEFSKYVAELTDEVNRALPGSRYDVIHAQHLGYGLSLAFCRARTGLPIISIAHGTDVLDALTQPQAADALREIVEASTAVVVPNRAIGQHVISIAGALATKKLVTIPWGIPLKDVNRRPRTFPAKPLLSLLHAGRLDKNKNSITALESLPHMLKQHPHTIIGDGSELEGLKLRAAELRLLDRVTFKPFMPRPALWREFASHDAFLFTTLDVEAFGLVAIEAQAHGLPVAFGNIDDMSETLGPGAIPYPAGDPRKLARAVDQLADDATAMPEMSVSAIDNAARFDVTETSRQLLELSSRVIHD